MIKKQLGAVFSSHVFYFVGAGGMMGGSYFHGEPGVPSAAASVPVSSAGDRYSYSSIVIRDGAVHYWKLAEASGASIASATVGGVSGVVSGPVSSAASVVVSSTEDTSYLFNGVGGSVDLGLHAVPGSMTGSPAITMETWIVASAIGSAELFFVSLIATGNKTGFSVGGSNGITNEITVAGRSIEADAAQTLKYTTSAGHLDEPLHVAAVVDFENDALRLYLNGALADSSAVSFGSTAFTYASATQTLDTKIGGSPFTGETFEGRISHVSLYASALSAAIINEHYLYGIGDLPVVAPPPPTGLSYASVVLLDDPIAYWQFNETTGSTALDSIASTYQGTYTNGVTLEASSLIADTGVFAVSMATTAAQHIALTSSPARGKDQFVVEAWFRPVKFASAGTKMPLYYEQNNSAFLRYMLSLNDTGAFQLDIRTTESGTVYDILAPASSIIADHDYHVVAMSHSSANTLQIFQNGVEVVGSATSGMAVIYNDAGVFSGIGNPSTGAARDHLNGRVDDVALYASVLSSATIRSHYARGKYASSTYPFAVINDGAVAYWRVNEANGAANAFSDIGLHTEAYIGTVSTGAPGLLGAAASAETAMELNAISSSGFTLGDVQLYDTTGNLSLEYWFRTDDTTAITRIGIYKGSFGNYVENTLSMQSTGSIRFAMSSANVGGNTYSASSGVSMWDGGIHHAVGVHNNPGNYIRLYINGVMVTSTTFSGDGYTGTSPVSIGFSNGSSSTWRGILDEIAVYATALTEDQVRSHNAHGRHFEDSYPFTIIDDKAVAYWRLGEANGASSAYPDAGLYTGTYTGTVSTGAAALVFSSTDTNTAMALTGIVSSGVNLGAVDLFDRTGSHSLEAWFQSATATEQTIITRGLIAGNWAEYQLLLQPGGSIKYSVTSTDSVSGLHSTVTPASTYADGAPHHVVAVHNNPSNYQHVYIDGALVASATFSSNVWSSNSDVTIGYSRSSSSVTRPFNGTLDDVAVYATALTGAQVLDHYSNGKENLHPYVSAIVQAATLYWRLDDPVDASTTYDSILNVIASAQAGASSGASSIVPSIDDTSWRINGSGTSGGIYLGSTFHEVGATFHGASAMTFEVWVDSDEAASIETIFTMYPGYEFGSNRAGFVAQFDTGPVLKFVARPNRTQSAETIEINVSSFATTTLHIVGVADWTNDLMWLYINGKLAIASTAATFTTTTWNYQSSLVTAAAEIGASKYNARRFNGNISHFSLYRSAVSPADVREHYRLGMGDDSLSPYASTVFADSPNSYWRLDEAGAGGAYDSVGAVTGTYVGTVSTGASGLITGDSNTAMALTAVSSSGVLIGDIDLFDRTGSHTFEGWFVSASAAQQVVFVKGNDDGSYGPWRIEILAGGGLMYYLSNADDVGGKTVLVSDTSTCSDGEIHHFAAVHNNSANRMGLYFDGVHVGSATFTGDVWNDTYPVTIGYRNGNTAALDGTVDEIAVYSTALASATILNHYRTGISYDGMVINDGAQSYWKLDETTGSTAVDTVAGADGDYRGAMVLGASALVENAGAYAARFDGVDDRIYIASAPNIGTARYTLEAWIKVTASSPEVAIIAEEYTGSGTVQYRLGFGQPGSGTTNLSIGHYPGGAWATVEDSIPCPLNEIIHVVGVKDAVGLKMYRNGVLVGSSATVTAAVVDGDGMWIGRQHGAAVYHTGDIDNVAVYATALSSATIAAHYERGV